MNPTANRFAPGLEARPHTAPSVVLDTNVVLDWLLFHDPGVAMLAGQLRAGRLRWLATAAMRTELVLVSSRPQFTDWAPDCEHILSMFDQWAENCAEAPNLAVRPGGLCCGDPDDQKFIDLAVAVGASWLISKDRALLALARPARAYGVEVLTPARWQQLAAPQPDSG
jgi:putative PIN family toxin of toxin-antitoxin system